MTDRARRFARVVIITAAACAFVSGQSRDPGGARPAAGEGLIAGTVVTDDAQPAPLRRVIVTLAETSNAIVNRLVTTDDAGEFAFRGLPAGRYTVSASRPPYLTGVYGAPRVTGPSSLSTGTAIVLRDAQQVSGLTVRLTKGAAIEGTIRDMDGQPARGWIVLLWVARRSPPTGRRALTPLGSQKYTDDRGMYRFYGLEPGEYYVSAQPPSVGSDLLMASDADIERALNLIEHPATAAAADLSASSVRADNRAPTVGWMTMLYPGTADVTAAQPLRLAVGEERSGVDFQVALLPTAFLEGTVIGLDGSPAPSATVRASAVADPNSPFEQAFGPGYGTSADPQGRFSISGLALGRYTITAQKSAQAGGFVSGVADVVIQGSRAAVTVTLQPPATVSGRVVFEGATQPSPPGISVFFSGQSFPFNSVGTGSQPNGEFSVTNVTPGRYRLSASQSVQAANVVWFAKSATLNGQSVLDTVIDIRPAENVNLVVTFSDRTTELSGTITNRTSAPAADYFIVVFPDDRSAWSLTSRIMETKPASDGKFLFKNLPAGTYRLAAVTDLEAYEWLDAAFLEQLVGASIKVTLAENAKVVQNIQVR